MYKKDLVLIYSGWYAMKPNLTKPITFIYNNTERCRNLKIGFLVIWLKWTENQEGESTWRNG